MRQAKRQDVDRRRLRSPEPVGGTAHEPTAELSADELSTHDLSSDAASYSLRRQGHYFVLYGLAAILVAISLWCFVILGRTESLRKDLARHMDWLAQAGLVRATLQSEPFRIASLQEEDGGGTAIRPEDLEQLSAATRRLVVGHGAPELTQAASRLEQRVEELSTVVALLQTPESGATPDDVAEAAYGVLAALPSLETQVQDHVVDLYSGIDRLWTSLRTLVILCLALCASNLGLLYLVHRRREQLETAHARAVALASHDALTGAWNRAAILRILRLELSRAERSGRPLGVILLDLDDFRKLNVLLGSREADHVLQETSRRLATFVRPYDTLGRLGGDSFLVILPSCDATATAGVADRLRHAIEGEGIEHAHGTVDVRATLVHETVVHTVDPDGSDDPSEPVDADLLVHGMHLRIQNERRR